MSSQPIVYITERLGDSSLTTVCSCLMKGNAAPDKPERQKKRERDQGFFEKLCLCFGSIDLQA